MNGRSNAATCPTTGCARSSAHARRRRLEASAGPGALPLALAAAIALAGCGGDDDPPTRDDPPPGPETVGPVEPVGPDGPAGPVTTGGPDEPVDPDPDGDDVPGLVVSGLDGRAPADAVSPWLLNTKFFRLESNTPGSGDVFVDLVRYEDDFPVGAHVDFYAKELDACRLIRTEPDDDPDVGDLEGGDPDDAPPPLVRGGSAITINTPAGPWFVLEGEAIGEDGTQVVYETNNGLPGPLPADATLSVPGDVFPNVPAFALPDEPAVPIRLLPDEDERLGLDTVYSWVPGDGSDYIEMEFLAFDAATGDFAGFPLVCLAVDDGRFTLPDDARTFLATTTDDVRLRYNRQRDTLTLQDGIVFRALTIVAE